ncbi:class I SAM-dependent methyltransferase [candidate division WOR-3 bacterium]|nr:class I SAM-dependent methyltransferase [candidate division WOR-3 bacterium]
MRKKIKEAQRLQKLAYSKDRFNRAYPKKALAIEKLLIERAFSLALEYIPPGAHVLDIGCDDGTIARMAIKRASIVIGIDISEANIRRAKQVTQNPSIQFYYSPIENYKTNLTFDVILMFELIEHLGDPIMVLKKVNNFLKENGTLILSTPNFRSLTRELKRCLNRIPIVREICSKISLKPPDEIYKLHIKEYDLSEIRKMLNCSGFTIKSKNGLILFPLLFKIFKWNTWLTKIVISSGSLFPSLAGHILLAAKKYEKT